MEGSSRARNSNTHDREESPHELKDYVQNQEIVQAAFTLCTLKNLNPAPEDIPLELKPKTPVSFNEIIGECSERYDRRLTSRDLNSSQCRLNISRDFADKYLVPMLRQEECLQSGIAVDTYDLEEKIYEMTFKIRGDSYVLDGGWTEFVHDQELDELDSIKLWMFRHITTDKLCFIILWKATPPDATVQLQLQNWGGKSHRGPRNKRVLKPKPLVNFDGIGEYSQPYERKLTSSDVNQSQKRLCICKEFAQKYLEPLLRPNESLQSGIAVDTCDLERKIHKMTFKICGNSYVLDGGWTEFVHDQKLDELSIKLWMFRHSITEKLCFIILWKATPPDASEQPMAWGRKGRRGQDKEQEEEREA